jgi:hypothetical protein
LPTEPIGSQRIRIGGRMVLAVGEATRAGNMRIDAAVSAEVLSALAPLGLDAGRVQRGQREEASVAQLGGDPTSRDLNRNFNFSLVTRPIRPRRDNGGVVVGRHLRVAAVDRRLVEAGRLPLALRTFDSSSYGGGTAAHRLLCTNPPHPTSSFTDD